MVSEVLAAFEGAVRCERLASGTLLRLQGKSRGDGVPLAVYFNGAAALDLPTVISNLQVLQPESAAAPWQLQSGSFRATVVARGAQVHREVGTAFHAAVPLVTARFGVRLGWALLLNVLRVPGMGRLLLWFRSR